MKFEEMKQGITAQTMAGVTVTIEHVGPDWFSIKYPNGEIARFGMVMAYVIQSKPVAFWGCGHSSRIHGIGETCPRVEPVTIEYNGVEYPNPIRVPGPDDKPIGLWR